jgi:Ca2+-dependent lipid-binding protein
MPRTWHAWACIWASVCCGVNASWVAGMTLIINILAIVIIINMAMAYCVCVDTVHADAR